MAKEKNNKKNTNKNSSETSGEKENGAKKTNGKVPVASEKESNAGLVATIIAVVAILVVAGSIGAFVLFIKAKDAYLDPLIKSKINNAASTEVGSTAVSEDAASMSDDSLSGSTAPSDALVIPGESTSLASDTATYEDSTSTELDETSTVSDEDEQEPEPQKVREYDFDSKLSAMDENITARYLNFDENQMSDAQMGLVSN